MALATLKTNIIYCGDCKDVLKQVPDESVDLIYLDPPFFSQKHYENFWITDQKRTKLEFNDKDWEKLRGSIDPNILREYEHIEERWKGGHKGLYVYIAYMRERLIQCERVLKSTGSIYLHCDWHAGHYLKMMMDEVFGYDSFQTEIIWHYPSGGASKKVWASKHDTILMYSKSERFVFNYDKVKVPYAPATISRLKYRGARPKNAKTLLVDIASGKIGKIPDDVWAIGIVQGNAEEACGYPTQKPKALLERIINASSNEGDLVLDPFCGCGTTLAVAKRLGRNFIGIDLSRVACDVMNKRLGGNVSIIGGETEQELAKMEPHDFARFIIVEKLGGIVNPKKSGDMGIDGWMDFKTVPVQVKRWQHKVGRPEIDKFKTAVERDKKTRGVIVANDFSRDCYEEVSRIKNEHHLEITLKRVNELLKGN